MSIGGLSNSALGVFQSLMSGSAATPATGDLAGSLKLRMAEVQAQTFGALITSLLGSGGDGASSGLDAILGTTTSASGPLDTLASDAGKNATGLSASGRNMSLNDPETAYRMMTLINAKEVTHKAEFAEMSDLKARLEAMRQRALSLGSTNAAAGSADVRESLERFVDAYNDWIGRFEQDLAPGGLLAATQAAHVSQWELEQSVENFFTGANEGFHGMRDLGLSVDPVSNRASLDAGRLDGALATNPSGVAATIREFSADFARAAELLNSTGNFVPNRLDNLDRAIDYIRDNKAALQLEFGVGDPAKPTGRVAEALASYSAMYDSI